MARHPPETAFAQGGLFFCGDEAAAPGPRPGLPPRTRVPAAPGDPFAVHLKDSPALSALYLGPEAEDDHHRVRTYSAQA